MKYLPIMVMVLTVAACTQEIAGLGPPSDPANETFAPSLGVDLSQMTRTADGLYYRDVVTGTGAAVATDTTITVNYSGYLSDGTLFDSGTSAPFATSAVVSGFREGLMAGGGMRVGGIRQLVIPSALGYGSVGSPPTIPRQATLIYRVELLSIGTP